jgi:mannose-6-phosphate isomerase class I
VLDREEDARILIGARPGTTREALRTSIESGTCESMLNSVVVQPGDTFYLPSGTVHALGAGIVAAEVQTPSDTTFRLFDFDRIDPATGTRRTLHVREALDCIDLENDWRSGFVPASVANTRPDSAAVEIVRAPQFEMMLRRAGQKHDANPPRAGDPRATSIDASDRPTIFMILDGTMTIDDEPAGRGDTVLIPAKVKGEWVVKDACRWLQIVPAV